MPINVEKFSNNYDFGNFDELCNKLYIEQNTIVNKKIDKLFEKYYCESINMRY